MLNRDSSDVVKSSTPIGEAISKGAGLYANEIQNARDSMERTFGSAVKELNLSLGTFGKNTTLGLYDGETVYLAKRFASNNNLTDVMRDTNGFHPSIGNKTGAEAVASHEIGHHLGRKASEKARISEQQIVENAGKTIGVKGSKMASGISEYARTNYSETIAEAFCDVYCNGKKASRYSTAITNEVKRILKG